MATGALDKSTKVDEDGGHRAGGEEAASEKRAGPARAPPTQACTPRTHPPPTTVHAHPTATPHCDPVLTGQAALSSALN